MTLATSIAAGPLPPALDIVPVPRMRIDTQSAPGAVALQTDIALRMAGLTGDEVFTRFPGVVARPLVGGENRTGVTGLTLAFLELLVCCTGGTDCQIAPTAPVRTQGQIGTVELIVTVAAEFRFMTAAAEPGIGTRGNRVADVKIRAVNVGHGVTEFPHLVGATGFVAVEAIILFVTGKAINGLGHRSAAMSQRPGRVVCD